MTHSVKKILTAALFFLFMGSLPIVSASEDVPAEPTQLTLRETPFLVAPDMANLPQKFYYDSGVNIAYPEDGVKGIYLTSYSAGNPDKVAELVSYMNSTDLNAMVIDIKDDHGHVTVDFQSDDVHIQNNTVDYISDLDGLMKTLEDNQIYPIARIVAFKDSLLAQNVPEMSFLNPDGSIW